MLETKDASPLVPLSGFEIIHSSDVVEGLAGDANICLEKQCLRMSILRERLKMSKIHASTLLASIINCQSTKIFINKFNLPSWTVCFNIDLSNHSDCSEIF